MPHGKGNIVKRYMTTAEVGEVVRAPAETVRYWRYIGKGPKSMKLGRRVLYATEDVEAWLADEMRPAKGTTTAAQGAAMTEHLPECFLPDSDANKTIAICICDRLRAAEQRAYDDRKVYSEAEVDAYQTRYYEQGQRDGWHAACEAAEDELDGMTRQAGRDWIDCGDAKRVIAGLRASGPTEEER